jgi:hypothetical protein
MQEHFFWNSFPKKEKNLYLIILFLLIGTALAMLVFSVLGTQNAFKWDVLSEIEQIPTVMDTFSSGGLRFNINGYAYIVKEHFLAAAMPFTSWLNPAFALLIAFSFALILTSITTLRQTWFLVGSMLIALVLASLQLSIPSVPIPYFGFWLLFLILIGTAFWINSFRQYTLIWQRFLIFFSEIIALALLIGLVFSKYEIRPLHGALAFGMLAFLVLTCIFIFMVAHEIVAFLVWIITRNAQKGKDYNAQFLLLGMVYLANLTLLFFKTSKTFGDWKGLFISPTMLLIVSTVIGLFYFKKWCESTNYLRFESSGAWLYAAMAILSFGTIAYAYISGNDALTEFFDDFIIFAHLAMGVAFIFHVFVNFVQPLKQGLEVHKVIYKPVFSPLLVVRMVGVAIVVVLFIFKNNFPLWQVSAGYFNGIGDFHRLAGRTEAAQQYYNDGLKLDGFNHHGNYANGTIAWLKEDKTAASYFFKQATQRDASEQAFAAQSRFFEDNDKYFNAIFTLREGIKKFPDSAPLKTNLAMLYDRTKLSDSVLYYLSEAKQESNPIYVSNLAAFWAKYGKIDNLKSIYLENFSKSTDYTSFLANQNAIQNKILSPISGQLKSFSSIDSSLNVSNFAQIFNRNANQNPTEKVDFEALQNQPNNGQFTNDLIFARACRYYYGGSKIKGIQLISLLTKDATPASVLCRRTLGIWLLQEGNYDLGTTYIKSSGDTASVVLLEKQAFKEKLPELQKSQAETLLKTAKTKADFDAALQKAPLNPYLVSKVAAFYSDVLKDDKAAYDFVFEALYLNEFSTELLQTHALLALKLGLIEYAETSRSKLKGADYQSFNQKYEAEKAKRFGEFK